MWRASAMKFQVQFVRQRNPSAILVQEWSHLQATGVLEEHHGIVCAFSRDQANKVYVQDKIREHADHVWDLLHMKSASVFVSGSASKMPASVAEAICAVIALALQCDSKDAVLLQRRLEIAGRYRVEAWS
jgi:sulfite reductase alpha subunit-like flavoprotein